jgi:diguanylate cyclase (GGDEF)-like protein
MTRPLRRRPEAATRAPLFAAAALSALAVWTAHATYLRRALRAARCDPVTGLPGRAGWTEQAGRIMRGRGTRTVILVDVDRFKRVNDTYGHAAGDELLAVTAARLCTWAARVGGGACGRLGGDEFTAISRRAVTDAETADLAALLARPVPLPGPGVTIPVTASVGAAACAGRGLPAGLAAADAAMYQAKHAGGGYRIATPADPVPQPDPARRARTRHHGPRDFAVVKRASVLPGSALGARPVRLRRVPGAASPGRRFVYLAGSPRVPGIVVLAWPHTGLRHLGRRRHHPPGKTSAGPRRRPVRVARAPVVHVSGQGRQDAGELRRRLDRQAGHGLLRQRVP